MAAFDHTKTLWAYTTDNDVLTTYRADTGYTAQSATLGGAAAAAPYPPPPRKGLKVRHGIFKTAGGVFRKVPFFTAAKYNDAIPGTTTAMVDIGDGQQTSATLQSLEGEHYRGAGMRS